MYNIDIIKQTINNSIEIEELGKTTKKIVKNNVKTKHLVWYIAIASMAAISMQNQKIANLHSKLSELENKLKAEEDKPQYD